jgi:hypothetical protein
MGKFWWFAFVCFLLAGAIAITLVYVHDSLPPQANAWLSAAVLWLMAPAAWDAVYRLGRGPERR